MLEKDVHKYMYIYIHTHIYTYILTHTYIYAYLGALSTYVLKAPMEQQIVLNHRYKILRETEKLDRFTTHQH